MSPRNTVRGRLLVVDDDESLRTALRKILEKAGYTVTLAGSVDEALGRLSEADFDLVLTDYQMPQKNGLALASAIATTRSEHRPPVVLMTAYGDVDSYLQAMDLDVVEEYINKPVSRDKLLVILNSVLVGSSRKSRGPCEGPVHLE